MEDLSLGVEFMNLQLPNEVIEKIINQIFPNSVYSDILAYLIMSYILGYVTLTLFFFNSEKKRKIWTELFSSEKIIFPFLLGVFSYFGATIFVVELFMFLNLFDLFLYPYLSLITLMASGGLLYFLLARSSSEVENRKFLTVCLKKIMTFLIYFPFTLLFLLISMVSTKYLIFIAWIAILIIFRLILKKKSLKKIKN